MNPTTNGSRTLASTTLTDWEPRIAEVKAIVRSTTTIPEFQMMVARVIGLGARLRGAESAMPQLPSRVAGTADSSTGGG